LPVWLTKHFKRVRAEHIAEQLAHRPVIIHHQNDWFHFCLCPPGISVSLIDSASLRRQIPLPVTFFQAPSHLQAYRHVKSVDRLFFVSISPKKAAYHQGIPTMKIWHRRCIVTAR
jgi:hypothetical protein